MTIKQFEEKYKIKLVNKSSSLFMQAIARLLCFIAPNFLEEFWTTIRFPFQDTVIYYPTCVDNPLDYLDIL